MADGLREVVAPLVVCFQRIPLRHVDDEHLSPHRMQVLHLCQPHVSHHQLTKLAKIDKIKFETTLSRL